MRFSLSLSFLNFIIILIQVSFIYPQCTTVGNQVLKVSTPQNQQASSSKTYQLDFQDTNLNLQYTAKSGIYIIDTSKQGATLIVNQSSSASKSYTLQQILIRGIPMFQLNDIYYNMELQLYFTGSDNIVLSIFLNPIADVSSVGNSQFFEAMDPKVAGAQESINLSSTLFNDFQNKTFNVYENLGIVYQSQTYTWLISSQIIKVDYQTFELFRFAINDPYVTTFYDSVNLSQGTCALAQSSVYTMSIFSQFLIASIVQLLLFFLFL